MDVQTLTDILRTHITIVLLIFLEFKLLKLLRKQIKARKQLFVHLDIIILKLIMAFNNYTLCETDIQECRLIVTFGNQVLMRISNYLIDNLKHFKIEVSKRRVTYKISRLNYSL